MTSLPQASTAVKFDTAGERELLLGALRVASARSRLITNLIESVGVSLRHKKINCTEAMQWLKEENALDLLDFGPREIGGAA